MKTQCIQKYITKKMPGGCGIVPSVATSMAPEKEPRPPSQGSEEGGGDRRNTARNRALSGGLGTHS